MKIFIKNVRSCMQVAIDNGILELTLSKQDGGVTGVRYKGIGNLLELSNREFDRGYVYNVFIYICTHTTKFCLNKPFK